VITIGSMALSWKDLILVAGGAFLVYKATHEIHKAVEEPGDAHAATPKPASFTATILQIIVIDMVFSIDSIVTAIGMAQHVEVMITAVVIAVGIMYAASGAVAGFIARHRTTKMLALAFLLLIGVTLAADGLGVHLDKGYIYAAMGFATAVEAINIFARRRPAGRSAAVPPAEPAPAPVVPAPRPKSTPASRARSRPKSAPRQGAKS
jgi:predicted tellurium resistance membrane protein TerC